MTLVFGASCLIFGILCVVFIQMFSNRKKPNVTLYSTFIAILTIMMIGFLSYGLTTNWGVSNNSADIKQQIEQPKEAPTDCVQTQKEEQTEPNDESEKAFHDINVGKTEGKLFVFYRTDCEPCRKEFYKLVELSKDENTYVCMTRSVYGKLVKDIVGVKYVPSAYRKIGDVWTLVDLD